MKRAETIATTLDIALEDTQNGKPFVSVVVPAYNETAIIDKNLGILYEHMESIEDQYRWEFIIVNDGSTDKTGDLAEAFAKDRDNVQVLHHMYNFRLGQALRFAFANCRGDYVVVMDLDLSYSPDHIERMLSKIRETRAKIVVASPYRKGGKVSNVPWSRKMLSYWANRFLCLTATRDKFSDKLTTMTGMVRAYDREFLSRLNLKAMDVDIMPEIIYKAMILRARIVEIPANLNWCAEKSEKGDKKQRKSSLRLVRSVIQSLLSGFIFKPFMFFILPGLALMLPSIYTLILVIRYTLFYYWDLNPSIGSTNYRFGIAMAEAFKLSPHSFIVGGISLVVAIQLISLGILALQKKRYYEELFHLGSTIYRISKGGDRRQKP